MGLQLLQNSVQKLFTPEPVEFSRGERLHSRRFGRGQAVYVLL